MEIAYNTATIVIALIGLYVAERQLRRAADALVRSAEANQLSAEANRTANLMAVLQLEDSINQARYHLLEAVHKHNEVRTADSESYVKVCIESYLNTIDRFCHCIRIGLVNEETYRRDYRRRIDEAVEKNEECFGPSTPYLHIQHVYQSWKADRSAVEQPQKLPWATAHRLALPQGN